MNIYYCPAVTYPGSFHIDPEPPEICGAEVPEPGYCPTHEEHDTENPWGNDEDEERT
jgi:hypothetical protein